MTKYNDRWELYQDAQKEWRWRRVASNGQIVGAASEGYKSRTACLSNAKRNGYEGN